MTSPMAEHAPDLEDVFGPHHKIVITYPSSRPMETAEINDYHKPHFFEPKDIATRHNPTELTDYTTLTRYRPHLSTRLGALYSLHKAAADSPIPDESELEHEPLLDRINRLSSVPGWTSLHVLTYLTPEGRSKMAVYRQTTVGDNTFTQLYAGSFALEDAEWPQRSNLYDLIFRRYDRAEIAFQLQLQREGWENFDPARGKWKPLPSHPRFHVVLSSLPSASTETGDCCPICSGEYGEGEQAPVALPCHHRHLACLGCLDQWCRNGGDPKCPHCRTPIFDLEQRINLRLGQDSHGNFVPDRTLAASENFDRSCADLDQFMAPNQGSRPLKVNVSHMTAILNYFLGKEKEIPQECVPKRFNPVYSPETKLLAEVLHSLSDKIDGETTDTKMFIDLFARAMIRRTQHEYYASGTQPREDQPINPATILTLRSDSMYFTEKLITRIVSFAAMRQHEGGEEFLHMHKGKMYYNPMLSPD
ncbi:hypothetical protein MYCFIDRAFT_177623 [Lecanosticta acicola]|uniref:RING-type domain-containing protein n=1 Tax=Lecanosticta acicola TaxID=111012 RepID=A0AAI9E8V6_9PEZI|nr:hypothetical protein MYCFIDRAFT_177623 [Lecanosticta acicola]